jgi:DNA-binding SARP family transcriptional activator/predicted ATPase
MAHLSLSLLGPFQATLAGEPVTGFASAKVRALLAYLAVEADRPHSREVLAGLLWPEWPDSEARSHLRHSLANLRKAIGDRPLSGDRQATPPYLSITRETIQFNRASDCWVDVAEFRALAEGDQPSQWETAATLYGGPFLQGFSIRDSAAFEEWSLLVREQIQRQALAVLHRLSEQDEARGAYERAQGYAWRQLELEPSHEEAHRQLMRLLALDGQRSAALAQYESCRRTLAEELGVEPGVETTALYERIRDGAIGRRPERPAALHNLPATTLPLIGRKAELAEVVRLLRTPSCRLLTVVGPGGIGKTRLALEAATRLLAEDQDDLCAHGVYWVSLAPLQSVETIVPTIAQALNLVLYGGREPKEQLFDYLRPKTMLLILDNAEHLLRQHLLRDRASPQRSSDVASLVRDILHAAPQVKVLTTSRARLNVQDEHLFAVAGLEYPEEGKGPLPGSAEDLAAYSAVELFVHVARRERPDWVPASQDLAQVACICSLVQGMPLAILMAAAWMEMLTPAEIVSHMSAGTSAEPDIDFLEAPWRDLPERQRSMRAVLGHSWSLLSERERAICRGLSVFRGGFTYQAARQVTGATLRDLMALVNRSLLFRAPTPLAASSPEFQVEGRYEMHELMRQYAAERLNELPAVEGEIRDAHCATYASASQGWEPDLKGPRQRVVLAEIEADIENVRAAWHWAVERGQVERLDQAAGGLCHFYERRGRYHEGEALCRMAVDRMRESSNRGTAAVELRVLAKVLAWQGVFTPGLDSTLQLLHQSLALLDSPALADQDVRQEKAFVLKHIGWITFDSDLERAARLAERSLSLYRALDDRWGVVGVLHDWAFARHSLGALGEARRLMEESLALSRALGDPWEIGRSLGHLGLITVDLGLLDDTERLMREGERVRQEIGGQADLAQVTLVHGWVLFLLGELDQACSLLADSLTRFKNVGYTGFIYVYVYAILSSTEAHLGRYEQARAHGQAGLALAQDLGFQWGRGACLAVLGWVALAEGAYADAHALLQESAVQLETSPLWALYPTLAVLGYAALGLGRRAQARGHLGEALRSTAALGSHGSLAYALPGIALLLSEEGEVERAIELYALASRHPFVAHSRWFGDVAGRHIAAAAQALPPHAVAAAQERGRARDLWATVRELLSELGEPEG